MDTWLLRYDGFDPEGEGQRESLCALGNGRFATRAAAPESQADGVHYPGTYAAGVFNRLTDTVDDHRVEHESNVNLPDWQSLRFRAADSDWVSMRSADVRDYVQELDLRRGVLLRRFTVVDPAGRRTTVAQRRFVSMADPFLAGLETTFVAENWSGPLVVRSGVDGRVTNRGVLRYEGLGAVHLRLRAAEHVGADVVALDVETTQSGVRVSVAARTRAVIDGHPVTVERRPLQDGMYVGQELSLELVQGQELMVEKLTALYTSHDPAISEPALEARDAAVDAPSVEEAIAAHVLAWDQVWDQCDIRISAAERTSLVLRLHLFHLLQVVSDHVRDLDVGVPARGLHGEAYRGHVFWDETFVFPYLNLRLPEVSRALLLYRWRRLPQARRAARDVGCRGAMFPWQSGSNGREESASWHLNPRSGRWLPDHSRLQRHVGLAIAYNVWHYYEATGDLAFLVEYGAELVLEVALFWGSIASYHHSDDRFDISGVMGPDEYHDGYPWRDAPGLDNNAYTNVMAAWVLMHALGCVEVLPPGRRHELLSRLGVRREDLEHWEDVSRKLRLCWHDDGILSQFEGYERLAEFDWDGYRARYGDISRLDRILEAEGDQTNRYRLSKQADVLMLCYLLSDDELREIVERLRYPYDPDLIRRNADYYLARTSHGSTLSKVVHAWVLARRDHGTSWDYFLQALESDIADVQGGTTAEGIHLGAMAGTLDLLQRAFTGLQTREQQLWLDPVLPDGLTQLEFPIQFRRHHGVHVTITHDRLVVSGQEHTQAPMRLHVGAQRYALDSGATYEVPLTR